MLDIRGMIDKAEEIYNLEEGTILRHTRTKTVADARATAMYAARTLTRYSFPEIAEVFQRDHSTVMHNCNKIVKVLKKGCKNRTYCNTIKLISELSGVII